MNTYTSEEIRAMAKEMSELRERGNIAADRAASALAIARRSAKAIEAGLNGKMARIAQDEIADAVAQYEAAKTFVTPEWEEGKPPYASWDKATKTFVVSYY